MLGKEVFTLVENVCYSTETGWSKISFTKKNLNCKNFGIYAAKSRECYEFYIGQTIKSF